MPGVVVGTFLPWLCVCMKCFQICGIKVQLKLLLWQGIVPPSFSRVVSECSGDDISDKIILHEFYAKAAVAHVCEDPEQVSENWRFLMWGPYVLISQDSPGTRPLKYTDQLWCINSQVHFYEGNQLKITNHHSACLTVMRQCLPDCYKLPSLGSIILF